MDTKNSTSKNKEIFLLKKYDFTYGPKYERNVELFRYNPEVSSFEFHNFYGRIRDVLRGIKRICSKTNTDFRVVYLKG